MIHIYVAIGTDFNSSICYMYCSFIEVSVTYIPLSFSSSQFEKTCIWTFTLIFIFLFTLIFFFCAHKHQITPHLHELEWWNVASWKCCLFHINWDMLTIIFVLSYLISSQRNWDRSKLHSGLGCQDCVRLSHVQEEKYADLRYTSVWCCLQSYFEFLL